jgi:hypothetical protein
MENANRRDIPAAAVLAKPTKALSDSRQIIGASG